jgi:hypothetical protein
MNDNVTPALERGSPPRGGGIFAAGAAACVGTSALVAAAVGLYFVWPYSPDRLDAAEILEYLAGDTLGGLVSLDILMLIIAPINMVAFIALFAALGGSKRPLAVAALAAGAVACAALIVCRPIMELVLLSRAYSGAATAEERAYAVSAAIGFLAYFKGTAWTVQTILFPAAGMAFAILMRGSSGFSKTDSTVGIIVCATAFGFMIPKIGIVFLFINTIGTIPWYLMIARRLSAMRRSLRAQGRVAA